MEGVAIEGESPVPPGSRRNIWSPAGESGCLGSQPKAGGEFHPRLNTCTSPIEDKYREGKLKRTLERECKVYEIAVEERCPRTLGEPSSPPAQVGRAPSQVRAAAWRSPSSCRAPPVLKHGPRSPTPWRVEGVDPPRRRDIEWYFDTSRPFGPREPRCW